MRRWLWLACLALAGCNEDWRIVSASPNLPLAELATPEELPGAYWQLDQGAPWTVQVARITRDWAGRSYSVDLGNSDEITRLRLVTLPVEDAYLMVGDSGLESDAEYLLLHDRGNGVMQVSGLYIDQTTPFVRSNKAWRNTIAARHGLTIDRESGSEECACARIDGEIGGMKIPMLFRDPAFLGTLEIQPIRYFLRAGGKALEAQGPDNLGGQDSQTDLTFAGPIAVFPEDTVQPEGLAGEYVSKSTCCIAITANEDGQFEVEVVEWGGKLTFAVMPIDADANDEYLALVINVENPPDESEVVDDSAGDQAADESAGDSADEVADDTDSSTDPQLIYLRQSDDCWVGVPIALRSPSGFEEIEAMRAAQMEQAAARHGLGFAGGHVDTGGGPVTSRQVRTLLADGQFTSGLDMAKGNSESIRMCPSTPRPVDDGDAADA